MDSRNRLYRITDVDCGRQLQSSFKSELSRPLHKVRCHNTFAFYLLCNNDKNIWINTIYSDSTEFYFFSSCTVPKHADGWLQASLEMLTLTSCFLTLKMTFPVGVTMTSTPLTTVSDNQLALFVILLLLFLIFIHRDRIISNVVFSLEGNDRCENNVVRTVCSQYPKVAPFTFTSSGSSVVVFFVSDSSVNRRGFLLKYKSNATYTTTTVTQTTESISPLATSSSVEKSNKGVTNLSICFHTIMFVKAMLVQLLVGFIFSFRFEHVHGCQDGDRHCFRVPGCGDIFCYRCCIYDITLS